MKDFQALLDKYNLSVVISLIGPSNKDFSNGLWHNDYTIVLKRGGKSISYVFHDSSHNYQNSKRPSQFDVVYALAADISYLDSGEKVTEQIHKKLVKQQEKGEKLFGSELNDFIQDVYKFDSGDF